ncbi:tRNA (adenosine(37)-N6)-dimethylallyltransferase MiaA [Paenibacillus sp.]|uniref:tRNA (adenosine(37)-N6)-dimethylallyltransferase MiaA n=1 Tax=Paenibacillus sp. TaxID=58172 RepID=UPI002D4A0BC9|nr:tRNA (adenosine(37)-N6)-dimethylallyltransferase MiaA [Paenibacillus sp.]HZG88562.1 tRNA (adenosine(37)-N6)-dimethylallyltransferase MiaA [Paenibacillus sp.]
MKKQPLLVIVGPTAVGKTAVSLDVAKRYPIDIISGDSVQVYRGMDIGSAKATPEERSAVPHYMIDLLDPDEPFTVADFKERVEALVADSAARGRLPTIVGGTGLYIESVVYDYRFSPAEADEAARARWNALADERGTAALHALLAERDPASAARIHPNDRKRLVRALEVFEATGRPMSEQAQKREKTSPYALCMIGLTMERSLLYERINRRVDLMLEEGLLEEVRSLLERGYDRALPSMQAIGYKELAAYLEGELSYEAAVELLKKNTRHFAKRQLSWFRTMPQIHWVDMTDTANFITHLDTISDIIATAFPSSDYPFNLPLA